MLLLPPLAAWSSPGLYWRMQMTVYFKVEESMTLEELGHDPEVCSNAAFVFDTPLNIEPEDALELTDGYVYLISKGVRIPIPGKWDR
jgi:hypothetical protein